MFCGHLQSGKYVGWRQWDGDTYRCHNLFKPILSSEGSNENKTKLKINKNMASDLEVYDGYDEKIPCFKPQNT